MKQLNKYLLLGAILLVGWASTMPTSIQAQQTMAPEVKEFETLIQEVLNTENTSFSEHAGISAIREVLKVIGTFGVAKLGERFKDENEDDNGMLTILLVAIVILSPALCELFIHKKNVLLTSLQKLQKYTDSLKPEQRDNIATLFKTKYADKLTKKVLCANDGRIFKIGRYLVTAADLVLLCLWIVYWYKKAAQNQKDTVDDEDGGPILVLSIGLFTAIFDLLAIAYNTKNSTDNQKSRALAKIMDLYTGRSNPSTSSRLRKASPDKQDERCNFN